MGEKVIITHKGCGGICHITSVSAIEYYDGDIYDTSVEYYCEECKKTITWNGNEMEGMM